MKINDLKQSLRSLYEKNKRQVLILTGAILLLFILFLTDVEKNTDGKVSDNTQKVYSLEDELEEKLEEFLQTVNGVGKTKVCVTFDVLEQTSYAQSTQSDVQDDRSDVSVDYIIIENADGSEGGLSISIRAPVIRGVAVACEGAGSQKVRSEVTALLTAALGISSNRVYVSQYTDTK